MSFRVEAERGWEVYQWGRHIDFKHLRLFWQRRANLFARLFISMPLWLTPTRTRWEVSYYYLLFPNPATSSLPDASDIRTGSETEPFANADAVMPAAASSQAHCWALAGTGRWHGWTESLTVLFVLAVMKPLLVLLDKSDLFRFLISAAT